jgi:gamma-glutamyl-gamma-aminobutyraldehyde dehydrogenase
MTALPTQAEIDAQIAALELDGRAGASTKVEGRAFINGVYQPAVSGATIPTYNPATGKVVAHIAACAAEDVEEAVAAAHAAFTGGVWSDMAPLDRKNVLLKFASLLTEHALELAIYDSVEAGKSIKDNLEGDVPGTVSCFQFHAEAINKLYDQVAPTDKTKLGLIVREPVGIVAMVVPWNFPLQMAAWKLAPALASGNVCILKPSEMTSLSAIRLGALANEAGIPPGVLNIVPGYGATAGAALAEHHKIDMVAFTGSTRTGRSILQAAAASNLKRVSLELGGKSPQLIFDDVGEPLDRIVQDVMAAAFWNQSENCSCGSRLIVQRGIKDRLLEKLVAAAQTADWKVGNPQDLTTVCGAMISPAHCEKVLGYIAKGKAEGAVLVLGGERVLAETGGDFVGLTIFDKVSNKSVIAQEEIFGPVLCVIEFDTEEEGIAIANDTKYGLAASVYTDSVHRAHRVARRLRAGNVSVNCFGEGDDSTPFGGYGQSGFVGRDKGIHAHEQYQEIKTIWYQIDQP